MPHVVKVEPYEDQPDFYDDIPVDLSRYWVVKDSLAGGVVAYVIDEVTANLMAGAIRTED